MKTRKILTYDAFVRDGCYYYPRVEKNTLILPYFSKNSENRFRHHKRTLIIKSCVMINSRGFVAVFHGWHSRFGYRVRWFYWRDGKRITFNDMTWDERVRVCHAYVQFDDSVDYMLWIRAQTTQWRGYSRHYKELRRWKS